MDSGQRQNELLLARIVNLEKRQRRIMALTLTAGLFLLVSLVAPAEDDLIVKSIQVVSDGKTVMRLGPIESVFLGSETSGYGLQIVDPSTEQKRMTLGNLGSLSVVAGYDVDGALAYSMVGGSGGSIGTYARLGLGPDYVILQGGSGERAGLIVRPTAVEHLNDKSGEWNARRYAINGSEMMYLTTPEERSGERK